MDQPAMKGSSADLGSFITAVGLNFCLSSKTATRVERPIINLGDAAEP